MYKLTYNNEDNRIYINVEGSLSVDEVNGYIKDMISMIDRTNPGFTVLADSSKSDREFLENSSKFQVIRDYGITKGFKNVATILSEEVNALHQTNPFPGIKNTFISIEEGTAFLNSLD